jgi:hypothetical protein
MTELLSSFVFLRVEIVPLPFAEQGVSKGVPQSRGLLINADAPKCWINEGMVPESLLEEIFKCVKFVRFPREKGIDPERELFDRSRNWSFKMFPRLGGMLPLSWF